MAAGSFFLMKNHFPRQRLSASGLFCQRPAFVLLFGQSTPKSGAFALANRGGGVATRVLPRGNFEHLLRNQFKSIEIRLRRS